MKSEFENSLCTIFNFINLTFETIKSCFIVLFFIFCLVFVCVLCLIKPLNNALGEVIEYNVVEKVSTSFSAIKNNNNGSLKNATKIIDSYVNQSSLDLNVLNEYINANLKDGQFDENTLKKLINSNLENGTISSNDINKILSSNTNNKQVKPIETTNENKNAKDTFKATDLIIPFIAVVFCSVFVAMIGHLVTCYADEVEINLNKMVEVALKNFIQISAFYIFLATSFSALLFLLNTFITGNKIFFNIVFAFLTVVIVLVIIAFLFLCARFVFTIPIVGLFDFGFLKSINESLHITRRFTFKSLSRSLFCTIACSFIYIGFYLFFNKGNNSFIFAFVLTVLIIFSSLYHSLLALNLSCLFNPKTYDFDDIVNDYGLFEPEKAEALWNSDSYEDEPVIVNNLYDHELVETSSLYGEKLVDDEDYKDEENKSVDFTNSKSVYVNLSLLKESIDCVNESKVSSKFKC